MKKFLLISIVFAFSFAGCVKNNTVPSYLHINKWILEENLNAISASGVLTKDFSNASIYVNNQLLGIFELPCTVPVLQTGSAEIRIYPVVLNNGISATKKVYPFMDYHTSFVTLSSNEITEINPVTRYKDNVQFWIEDFEGAIKMNEGNPSPASLIVESASNGTNKYGRVYLNSSQNAWAAYTIQELAFPIGTDVYLELDYYNTNNIVTGLLANKANGSSENHINIQMNQQADAGAEWKFKKIYIDLKELVNLSGGTGFLQTFQAKLDDGDSEGLIYIDNIKVVYY